MISELNLFSHTFITQCKKRATVELSFYIQAPIPEPLCGRVTNVGKL